MWKGMVWLLLMAVVLCGRVVTAGKIRAISQQSSPDLSIDQGQYHPAFVNCWEALQSASANQEEITKVDYLDFLRSVSRGIVDVSEFKKLSLDHVALFYAAACQPGRECNGPGGSFELSTHGNSMKSILALCSNVMKQYLTTATIEAGISVEFDPVKVTHRSIDACIEETVRDTVLIGFRCNDSQRELEENAPRSENGRRAGQNLVENEKHRQLESESGCQYLVNAEVASSVFIDCIPTPEGDGPLQCGSVTLEITVSVHRTIAPFEDDLKYETEDLLKAAINDGSIEHFFPPGCF